MYISGIFFKTRNLPFSISKTTDKSKKNKSTLIVFQKIIAYTCYICLWHEILLENDIYDRTNIYLICSLEVYYNCMH